MLRLTGRTHHVRAGDNQISRVRFALLRLLRFGIGKRHLSVEAQ
jgi:hypothetical protein